MEKLYVVVLGFLLLSAGIGNVQEKRITEMLVKSNFSEIIRPDDDNRYVGTLFIDKGELRLYYEAMGFTPSIMGYKFDNNKIKLLIKSRWTGAEESFPNESFIVDYHEILIFERDGKISYSCSEVKLPRIADYTITMAIVNADHVNLRERPSLSGKKVKQTNTNQQLRITSTSDRYDEIQNMKDYWYEFIDGDSRLWIFGYFIDFQKSIPISN